jgi:hypothetical protein
MRTVLTLDEDAADILRAHAERRGVSMGTAASELIRIGSRDRAREMQGGAAGQKKPSARGARHVDRAATEQR